MIFIQILLLVAGFVLLIKGADFFVDGSSAVAKIFHIPSVIIGLTIVSMGTSLPELAVSVTSAINGTNGIAIGNVVGSNIVNLMLVAGITAAIIPVAVEKSLLVKDLPFSILMAAILLLMVNDVIFSGTQTNTISRADGIILLSFFAVYMYSLIAAAISKPKLNAEQTEEEPKKGVFKYILLIIIGLAAIIIGGQLVVKSAVYIATAAGMSDRLIGLTIIAFGTSLPELITSLVAAFKGENDIAMGNVIGSNIFNILFILGISSTITPITVSKGTSFDLLVLLGSSVLVLFLSSFKKRISRPTGILMFLVYVTYTVYIFIN